MKQIRFKVHSICVFLMFLLMIPFGAFAQQGMVTGQVVDEKGESVIGATVQIKGTSDGTITSNPQLSSSASFLRLNVLSSLN